MLRPKPNLEALREQLRAPLPKEAIKPDPRRNGLSAINGAYITERLNDCFGEDGWTAKYQIIENHPDNPMIVVRCDFVATRYKIHRQAFGGNANQDRGDAYKGACTDALGKVASHLGIASDVYKGMHDAELKEMKRQAREERRADREDYERVSDNLPCTDFQLKGFFLAVKRTRKTDEELNLYFAERGVTSVNQFTRKQMNEAIRWASKVPDDLTQSLEASVRLAKITPNHEQTNPGSGDRRDEEPLPDGTRSIPAVRISKPEEGPQQRMLPV